MRGHISMHFKDDISDFLFFLNLRREMPRRVSAAARFPRQHESEAKEKTIARRDTQKDEKKLSENNSDESKTWTYLFFGGQHSRARPVGANDKLEYLDLLPPKVLREEEHELRALMVHSR